MPTEHEAALETRFLNKRVRPSWRTLRRMQMRYISCSSEPRRTNLRKEFDDRFALRGVVIAVIAGEDNCGKPPILKVRWGDGEEQECPPYSIDIIE